LTAALAFFAGAGFLVTLPLAVFLVRGLLVLALAAGFLAVVVPATFFLGADFLTAGAGAAIGSMMRGLEEPVLERVYGYNVSGWWWLKQAKVRSNVQID
jgi:hypothetical protein